MKVHSCPVVKWSYTLFFSITKRDSLLSNASGQGSLRPVKVPTIPDTKSKFCARASVIGVVMCANPGILS